MRRRVRLSRAAVPRALRWKDGFSGAAACRDGGVPYNIPFIVGTEFGNIQDAIYDAHLAADGRFTDLACRWLERVVRTKRAMLTHSGTAALELAALLCDLRPGDEVIMPSFTFVSTANAFALRQAIPVFVDIRPDTLNIDEKLIEQAITPRTRVIVPVHYAGVACEMDPILRIARRHGLVVVEDAAHAMLSRYRGRMLGSLGHFGALSFHETKNIVSGEGGALLVNDRRSIVRGDIIRQKGTNRAQFLRGEVDKYTWVDIGSSFGPSEIIAAFLWSQMARAVSITNRRLRVWSWYHESLEPLERLGVLRRPIVPAHVQHNAHIYYVLLPDVATRTRAIQHLAGSNVRAVFHYVPLHSSPAGRQLGRAHGSLEETNRAGDRLLRLPLWVGMTKRDVALVTRLLAEALRV